MPNLSYNENGVEGFLPALMARLFLNTANDRVPGVVKMALDDNGIKFNDAARDGFDQAFGFSIDMDPDSQVFQTNLDTAPQVDVDIMDVVTERLRNGFQDPVQESSRNTGPQSTKPDPAQQSGIKLQAAFDNARLHSKGLDKAQAGQSFSANGKGAHDLNNKITGKEQAAHQLQGALADYKKMNPDKDPAKVAPEEGQGGPGIGGKVAQLAIDTAIPVLPVARAVAGVFNGEGSFKTFGEQSQYSASSLDQSSTGYQMAASASPAQDRQNIMQPQPAVQLDVDKSELMGNIKYIVEPGMEGMKPGEFSVNEVMEIEACCAQWQQDAAEARDAFENWRNGPIQVTDLNDVKELPVRELAATEEQMAQLTQEDPTPPMINNTFKPV